MVKIDFNLEKDLFADQFLDIHASDLAHEIKDLEQEQISKIIDVISDELLTELFITLDHDEQVVIFNLLSKTKQIALLKTLEIDDLKLFIEDVEDEEKYYVFSLLSKQTQEKVIEILSYDEGSAGSILSPHFMVLDPNMSIKDATNYVITKSSEKDEVETVFFLNKDKTLYGALKLQDLIIARPSVKLDDIIDKSYPTVYVNDPIDVAIKEIRDYDIATLAVLNKLNQMVGIITDDDILYHMTEEHEEAFGQMVSINNLEDDMSAFSRSKGRLPWLLASVMLNLVIASVLTVFMPTLEAHYILVLFQPMILGMAGNIGTQSLAVTILMIHQDPKHTKKHINKEIMIGVINSLLTGLFGFIVVYTFLTVLPQTSESVLEVSLAVGLSLVLSMFISALVGVLLPFLLRKLGADEKAAGGPIISTVNDLVALGSYLLIATLLLITFA